MDQKDPSETFQRELVLQLQKRCMPVMTGLCILPAFVKKNIRPDPAPGIRLKHSVCRIDEPVIQGDPKRRRRVLLFYNCNLRVADEKDSAGKSMIRTSWEKVSILLEKNSFLRNAWR